MDISTGIPQEKIDAIFEECDLMGPKAGQMRAFCVALLDCDYNSAEACRRAGYEGNNAKQRGWQYMQEPKVKKAITLLSVEASRHNQLRVDFVLRKMLKGAQKAEDDGNLTAMARFVEMIGKHLGMFKEQVELSGKDGKAIEIENRTKEDVAAFKSAIDGLAKRGGAREASPDTKH